MADWHPALTQGSPSIIQVHVIESHSEWLTIQYAHILYTHYLSDFSKVLFYFILF